MAGPVMSRASRNAISDSTRGWMNRSRCTGSPCAKSMPLVTRPYSGAASPMACCLLRLVRPSFQPTKVSPASSFDCTNSFCASNAVSTGMSGCSSLNCAMPLRSRSDVTRVSAIS